MTAEQLVQELGRALGCEAKHDVENEEWNLDVALQGGRRQEITVRPFEEEQQPMVRFFTVVGPAKDFPHPRLVTAMELNASLRFGALALYEGNVVLTDTAALAQPAAEIVEVARYLVRMADAYERILFGFDRA